MTKNAIIILEPFDALEIYAALEVLEERGKITTRALQMAVDNYKKQINENLTDEQLDDANAERALRLLLDKYF